MHATTDWMESALPYVRRQITGAVSVVSEGADAAERVAAARIVRALVGALLHDQLDEALIADVVNVLDRRLDDGAVVRHLFRALVIGCPDAARLTAALERLAARAAGAGYHESLWHLVCGMLEAREWRASVREDWARQALTFVTESGKSFSASPERLIRAWLDLHVIVPDWMAPTMEQRPALLASPPMPSRWVWPLHAAAPTTKGWQLLAGSLHHKCQPLDARAFGPQLDVALETLDRALGEERDLARRVALAAWLGELGSAP